MDFKCLLCFLFFYCITISEGYRILGLFSHPGKSHVDVFVPLLNKLAERGHEVTVISHFPLKNPPKNYHDVSLAGTDEIWVANVDIESLPRDPLSKIITPAHIGPKGLQSCENALKSKQIQDFLARKPKFDLVILEFFNSDCFLSIAHQVDAPFIGISSCLIMPWTYWRLSNPDNPAFIQNVFMEYSDKMTFTERVMNTLANIVCRLVYYCWLEKDTNALARKYVDPKMPSLSEYGQNCSLVLANTHFSLHKVKPYFPNIVEVGGIHITDGPSKLPQNLEKWITESEHGVIYFSLGSMIKGHTFPQEKRKMFLRAFSRLPQRVLWKWENDSMPGASSNVLVQKWMPQFDVLCHPNVKAFISHGGLLGTTEAVHCGVPMVVMPQYGDQHTNSKAVETSGGGVILQYTELSEENIYNALKTVLDPKFNKQAKELSYRFKDRPMKPMDTAIYWVEYVARHKGAPHMRSAATNLTWYQYYLLDVIGFLALIVLVTIKLLTVLLRKLLEMCCRRKSSKQKTN